MEEKEMRTITHAKQYFENLAQGIDPVNRQPAPVGQLTNRDNLNRLFTSASRFLQEELNQAQGQAFVPPRREEELRRTIAHLCALELGLDPFRDSFLPSESVLAQERVSKCFNWTQQILRRRLEREAEETVRPGAVYALSPEQVRRRIVCSQEPVPLSKILTPAGVLFGFIADKTVFSRRAHNWLIQEGLLDNGDKATSQGETVGLLNQEYTGRDGNTYLRLLCSGQAQRFLLKHLEDILAFGAAQLDPLLACLTPEFTGSIPCLPETVSPTVFLKHINSCLPPDLPVRFATRAVNSWLVKQGLLEDVFLNGKRLRRPTEAGEAVGISFIKFKNTKKADGSCWTPDGQRFILSHLRDIALDIQSGKAFQLAPVEVVLPEGISLAALPENRSLTNAKVTDWLNALLEPHLGVRVPREIVSEWLAAKGFLIRINQSGEGQAAGETMLVPTEQGEDIGLALENATNWEKGSNFAFLVYGKHAQRYVRDHVKEIFEFWRDW